MISSGSSPGPCCSLGWVISRVQTRDFPPLSSLIYASLQNQTKSSFCHFYYSSRIFWQHNQDWATLLQYIYHYWVFMIEPLFLRAFKRKYGRSIWKMSFNALYRCLDHLEKRQILGPFLPSPSFCLCFKQMSHLKRLITTGYLMSSFHKKDVEKTGLSSYRWDTMV